MASLLWRNAGMLRLIKRITLLLLSVFMISMPVAADPAPVDGDGGQVLVPAGPADLCRDDERVLLAVPGYDYELYYVYDEQGNCLGRLPATGMTAHAKIVRKNALFPSRKNGELIRAGDLETVAVYPPESYTLLSLDRHYVTIEKNTGIVTLYDESTQPLGTASTGLTSEQNWDGYGRILELPNAFFVRLKKSPENIWIRFDKNSREGGIIRDQSMLMYLEQEGMEVYSFGQYLVTVPYTYAAEAGLLGVVMTEDGTVILDRIEEVSAEYDGPYGPYSSYDSFYLYKQYDEDMYKANAIVQNTGSAYIIYDSSLHSLGCLYEKPDYFLMRSGFAKGLAYQEFNGNICEGVVTDIDTQARIPYAREDDMLLIWKNGTCLKILAEGTPEKISYGYLVTAVDDEGTKVYRLEDNCLVASYNRTSWQCLSLGTEGILLYDDQDSETWWDGSVTIYDNAGNATYHSQDRNHYAFVRGTWTCRRGIYRGLIDMYGNWVIKDIDSHIM